MKYFSFCGCNLLGIVEGKEWGILQWYGYSQGLSTLASFVIPSGGCIEGSFCKTTASVSFAHHIGIQLTFAKIRRIVPTALVRVKPAPPFFMLNIDRSSRGNLGPSCGRRVCCELLGLVLMALSRFFGHGSSLEAKLNALLLGVNLCILHQLLPL
ncbi:hypothetical protein ACH5RR_029745 [Cinchona calisaya]|uniref:Uncharacterized protein n=1 Tax=Cinchona calisaya TaxID=153742 RepID=A0ABD2YSJ9_9GENT